MESRIGKFIGGTFVAVGALSLFATLGLTRAEDAAFMCGEEAYFATHYDECVADPEDIDMKLLGGLVATGIGELVIGGTIYHFAAKSKDIEE